MDTSDPKEVQKAIKKAKTRDENRDEALLQIMSTVLGRLWLHDFLEKSGPGRNPFSPDAIQMAFNCGELNIGQQLMVDMHRVSSELYLQMMKENANG